MTEVEDRPSAHLIISDGKDMVILRQRSDGKKQICNVFKNIGFLSLVVNQASNYDDDPKVRVEKLLRGQKSKSDIKVQLNLIADTVHTHESYKPILTETDILEFFSVKELFLAVNKILKKRESNHRDSTVR